MSGVGETPEGLLAGSPLFGALPADTLREMFANARLFDYPKGTTIDNDGGMEWFNVLLAGRVKLLLSDPISGRNFAPFLLEAGEAFDLITLLDGAPHTTTPVVQEAATLWRLPMAEARAWLKRYPAFNAALLPYLATQMRHLESLSASVIFDDTATRLARIILRHARPVEGEERILAVEGLSHELLAELVGSVRSVVSTQLKKLREEGLIMHRRGRILVEDLEKLRQRIER
jgi:CRP-like cAMP-binding protein